MTLQRVPDEPQSRCLVPCPGDVALQHLPLVIDSSPEVDHLTIELHVHLVEMPLPVAKLTHAADPLPADVGCENGAEPVPPMPNRLMADVDPPLEQQVLDVP